MNGIENLQPSLNVNGIIFYRILYPKDTVAVIMKLQLLHGGNEMLTGGQKLKKKSTLAKSTTPIDQTNNLDSEAVGKLSYSDLHRIIMAALEGGCKQQQAYRAFANN